MNKITTLILIAIITTLALLGCSAKPAPEKDNPVVRWPCTRAEAYALCGHNSYTSTTEYRYNSAWAMADLLSNDIFIDG